MRSALVLLALLALCERAAEGGPAGRDASPVGRKEGAAPVRVGAFAGPAEVAALGAEVGRALGAALQPLRPEARPGEAEVEVKGRLEPGPEGRLRALVTCRGQTVEVSGDLEHLDELVRALAERLRPLLADAPRAPEPAPEPRPEGTSTGKAPVRPVGTKPEGKAPGKPPAQPEGKAPGKPPAQPEGKAPGKPPAQKDPPRPAEPSPPLPAPPREPAPPEPVARPDLAPPEPPRPEREPPRPEREPDEAPRVAVSVVGEPVGQMPPGLYGIGLSAQGVLVQGLQRHHLRAAAARIVGLVGGRDAMAASLRVGARYTLMARLEGLVAAGEFSSLTLTGRLHIVLLFDGRLRFDRAYPLPPTAYSPPEPASSVASRAIAPLIDAIAADVAAKL